MSILLDTNVPILANLATHPDPGSDFPHTCVEACVDAIEHVVRTGGLIIDADDEIYDEYIGNFAPWSGQPGVGDIFMKWVHDSRWSFKASQRVPITRRGESYEEFPTDCGLENFDRTDRKFVAVSNAHPDKPPILQATDSKWWGWKEALARCGIEVAFLCPDYVEAKHASKMGK